MYYIKIESQFYWRLLLMLIVVVDCCCERTSLLEPIHPATMVIPLRPEEVPNDLICSICLSVPLVPALTPCDHVFCKECIDRSIAHHAPVCPIDRTPCQANQIRFLKVGSFVHRIWSSVMVKCAKHENGCSWTGSISDYTGHMQSCRHNGQQQEQSVMRDEVNNLNRRVAQLVAENKGLISEIHQLVTSLDQTIERGNPLLSSTGGYAYDRYNVVQLNGLISRNVENKPETIDSNRIYNCVKSCYDDLKKNYGDNPDHYNLDVRMLLATCAASCWFTSRQLENLNEMLREIYSNGY
jgi:hypothetical protein